MKNSKYILKAICGLLRLQVEVLEIYRQNVLTKKYVQVVNMRATSRVFHN